MKAKKEKIIVKEVPEAGGGNPYLPEQRRGDLRGFALSDEARGIIEERRKARQDETERLKQALGFDSD